MKEAGIWTPEMDELMVKKSNQAIISGTADYSFKHFAQYWSRYKKIVESQGDPEILEDIFGGPVPENLIGEIIVLLEYLMNLFLKDSWMINKLHELKLLYIVVSIKWNMLHALQVTARVSLKEV